MCEIAPVPSRQYIPVPIPPRYDKAAERDNGIRESQTMQALAKLRPVFAKTGHQFRALPF